MSTKFLEPLKPPNPLPQNQNSPQNPKINHWHENHTREDNYLTNKPFPRKKQPFYLWFHPIVEKEQEGNLKPKQREKTGKKLP